MRIFLTLAFVLTCVTAASALPFQGDRRCPNVNQTAITLRQHEQSVPQDGPDDYIVLAQAYEKCMQIYAKAGDEWQAYYAGTNAMQWAWGGAQLLAGRSVSRAQLGYLVVHRVFTFLTDRGLGGAQYGTQWQTMDEASRKQLGLK